MLVVAPLRSGDRASQRLMSGADRTCGGHSEAEANDPNRTCSRRLFPRNCLDRRSDHERRKIYCRVVIGWKEHAKAGICQTDRHGPGILDRDMPRLTPACQWSVDGHWSGIDRPKFGC